MAGIKVNYPWLFRLCALLGIIIFTYFYPDIILHLFIAFIIMLIGKPITDNISNIKLFKRHIPRSIGALLTILLFILILVISLFFFIPSLVREFRVFQNFDYDNLIYSLSSYFNEFQNFLYNKNLISDNQTFVDFISTWLNKIIDFGSVSNMLSNAISSTGSFVFGLFTVFFIAFFFLKDDMHIEDFVTVFVGKQHVSRVTPVVAKMNHLLSRYFTGLLIKTLIMVLLLYIGFLLFGIKGALMMAFIGGVTNIIPYLGPFIGWGIVSAFSIIHCIGIEMYGDIIPVLIKIGIVFIVINGLENMVLSPVIFSQSVEVHPVEVFLVTILGGKIGGMVGMILGIPIYTIFRILVIEIYRNVVKDSEQVN
ncbi:AI-2E family transporter [Bacteroidales bacterium OttesenSCG-928-M06]|nr:AI-2E family transporter [Bacteroidales bacterium OttesenSCG-928-M06]